MADDSRKRPGESKMIYTLFAAVATNKHGDQGIVATYVHGVGGMPAVFTRSDMIDRVAEAMKAVAKETGECIEIVEFHRSGTLKVIEP